MSPIAEKILAILKKMLFFIIFPIALFVFLFFLGEHFEVNRLAAKAECESVENRDVCMRSKGYLARAPYYPDLGRRYLGALARLVGGDLASYHEAPPVPLAPPAEQAPAAAAAPVTAPEPVIPPPAPPANPKGAPPLPPAKK